MVVAGIVASHIAQNFLIDGFLTIVLSIVL
jgi:hypothetical protein